MKNVVIEIRGYVQNVYFRHEAKKLADKLKLKGLIKNHYDWVVAEVEGPEDKLEEFIKWCHRGPVAAKVESVKIEPGTIKGYESFEIN